MLTNLASGICTLPSTYWILDTAHTDGLKKKNKQTTLVRNITSGHQEIYWAVLVRYDKYFSSSQIKSERTRDQRGQDRAVDLTTSI